MFEATYRKQLQIQRAVIEIKKSQASLDNKITAILQEAENQVRPVKDRLAIVEQDKEALDARTEKLMENVEDLVNGIGANKVKIASCARKVDKLETAVEKGTMMLKIWKKQITTMLNYNSLTFSKPN